MLSDVKILLSLVFSFLLVTGSLPLISIAQAYASSYENDKDNDYKDDFIREYKLPKDFNQPTPDTPWPDEIIPERFSICVMHV